ncbi:MAG: hypothetical protein AMDU1_APLC00023G0005 [Thermoplasmatales archaeon A-plasma]|jgi:hypothetical protein|nr:MAG: hypothetical protein AMDU1_APLC00023G0005 [Thermoplasmatales archaeon A-plasma]
MPDPVRKVLKDICSDVSEETLIDEHSKKFDLLDHTVLLVRSALKNQQLADIALESGISKLICFLYYLYSYKREYILLEGYVGESREGFNNLLLTLQEKVI